MPNWNNKINEVPLNFEVSQTPLVDSPICGTWIIEMFGVATSPRLNQVNTPTGNNQKYLILPNFEVSRTPLVDSPICGSRTIEMS
jgi:hypothetical protein